MPAKGYAIKTAPAANLGSSFFGGPKRSLFIALISGVLMGLTAAPGNAWLLAWIALAPLWVLVLAPGSLAPRRAAFAWALGYHGIALAWIRDLHPLTWMGVPWLASLAITGFCWAFITLWGVIWVMLWAEAMRWICGLRTGSKHQSGEVVKAERRTKTMPVGLRVLLGTALWCGIDAFWGQGVLYWTSLAFTQSPHNLVLLHLGQISGPWTVTAAIVAFNGILAEAWLQFQGNNRVAAQRLLIGNAAFWLALHLLGFVLYSQPLSQSLSQPLSQSLSQSLVNQSIDASEDIVGDSSNDMASDALNSSSNNTSVAGALKVGIVQGNIPTRIKLFEQGLQLSLDRYLKGYLTLAEQGVDVVLTPEGALPWLWITQPTDQPLYRTIVETGVPAWIGTVGLRQGKITQTLFSIDRTGTIVGRYDKVKLVPLGEYIPFESVLGGLIDRLSPMGASMLPGQLDQQFETPFGQAIGGICYESSFAELFRRQAASGGQFILTASNNDPYGRAMMAQHHAQDVMRSIETDRWAVRATNTGLSGIVDSHGRTQWRSNFRTYETHAHTIYRRQTQTLYVRWGNWLTPGLLLLSGLLWIRWRQERGGLN